MQARSFKLTDAQRDLAAAHIHVATNFARFHRPAGWDRGDFRDEMVTALLRATQTYDPSKSAFGTWASRIMEGRIRTLKWMQFQKCHRKVKGQWVTRDRPTVSFVPSDELDQIAA